MTSYIFAVLWLVIAAFMVYLGFKESKFFLILSVFFLFLAGWTLIDALNPALHLFSGFYGWIFRGVAAAALILCIIRLILNRKGK